MVPAASTATSQVASRIVDALAPVTVAGFRLAARVAGTEPVEFGRIADVLVRGRAVHLLWAAPGGDWQALGEVHLSEMLGEVEDARLDLDPHHTVPDLVPVGVLNQLRRPTYAASRAGRHAARGGEAAVTAPTATRPGG